MPRPLHPTALVTGGNRGIGRAIAVGLKARGCLVTLTARDEAEGRRAAAEVGTAFARLDLADPDTAFDVMTRQGGFDIIVNNAGILNDVSLLDRRSDFDEAMEVMVAAPLDLIRMNLPHWTRDGVGPHRQSFLRLGQLRRGAGGTGCLRHRQGRVERAHQGVAARSSARRQGQCCLPRLGRHPHGRGQRTPHARAGCRYASLARPSARRRSQRWLLPQPSADPVVTGFA